MRRVILIFGVLLIGLMIGGYVFFNGERKMAESGVTIPINENSHLPAFRRLFRHISRDRIREAL